jgi:hypothetical protein
MLHAVAPQLVLDIGLAAGAHGDDVAGAFDFLDDRLQRQRHFRQLVRVIADELQADLRANAAGEHHHASLNRLQPGCRRALDVRHAA